MVEHLYIEELAYVFYFMGNPDICLAGAKAAGGMVMAEQQFGGCSIEGFPENDPGIYEGAGNGAGTDLAVVEYFIGVIEIHHIESFRAVICEHGLKKQGGVCSAFDHLLFADTTGLSSSGQLHSRQYGDSLSCSDAMQPLQFFYIYFPQLGKIVIGQT